MTTTTLLLASAVYHFAFGIFHLFFWKILRWTTELPKMNFASRQAIQVSNCCLIALFFSIAAFIPYFQTELATTALGQGVLWLIGVFWFIRFGLQFLYFGKYNFRSTPLLILTIAVTIGFVLHTALLL